MRKGWKEVRLGDVCKFQNGYAFKSEDFLNNGKYKVIRIKELKDGEIRFHEDTASIDFYSENLKPFAINNGDILFALTGDPVNRNNPLSWVGRVSKYIYSDTAFLNQRLCKVLADEKKLDKNYLYYYFRLYENFFSLAQKATGSASQANISTKLIGDFKIELPPLQTQHSITAILSCLDEKINLNTKINHHLEQQCYAFYQRFFIEERDPSWEAGTIADFGEIIGGSTPSKANPEYYTEHGIAWITPKDLSMYKNKFISRGETDITELGLRNSSVRIMPRGTVLFSSRAPIGYIAIANSDLGTNQGFKSIIPKENIGTAFVYFYLKDNLQIIEGMASGSTFKEVSGSTMKSIPVVIPDSQTLNRFTSICNPIFEQQEFLEQESSYLAALRDTLLPKLMSGELSVSDFNTVK